MGIGYKIISTVDEQYNLQLGDNAYCNMAWSHINWRKIFDVINFKISILYDNDPGYWSVDQVKYVYSRIEKLYLCKYDEFDMYYTVIDENFIQDIKSLYLLFKEYTDKECIIYVY